MSSQSSSGEPSVGLGALFSDFILFSTPPQLTVSLPSRHVALNDYRVLGTAESDAAEIVPVYSARKQSLSHANDMCRQP
jgi:hypothetical protein